PFLEQNPDFDPKIIGCFMEALYGGQSEVRIRHKPVEGLHADFKSQFTTANALMGIQELLIANKIPALRGDTGEFPWQLFDPDWGLRLVTVAERLRGYFMREEPKSLGDMGYLQRRHVVGLDKEYIGKESHPLAELSDNPDDETLEEFADSI